jgi:hypothetical protein
MIAAMLTRTAAYHYGQNAWWVSGIVRLAIALILPPVYDEARQQK